MTKRAMTWLSLCLFAPPAAASPPTSPGHASLQKACDGGDPRACFELAQNLEHGVGVPQDQARSANLLPEGVRWRRVHGL